MNLVAGNNQFGSRVFVAPELVSETLARGWPASRELPSASARALYVLFLIAEVHPFNDGNGRISRLGMNAELEASGQTRLIIPTSLRNDYLTVLEALTGNSNPAPFIAFAHKLAAVLERPVYLGRLPLGVCRWHPIGWNHSWPVGPGRAIL
jgi:hypothetical protein